MPYDRSCHFHSSYLGGALSGTPQPAGQSGTQSNGGSSTNIGLIVGVVVGMVVGVGKLGGGFNRQAQMCYHFMMPY